MSNSLLLYLYLMPSPIIHKQMVTMISNRHRIDRQAMSQYENLLSHTWDFPLR